MEQNNITEQTPAAEAAEKPAAASEKPSAASETKQPASEKNRGAKKAAADHKKHAPHGARRGRDDHKRPAEKSAPEGALQQALKKSSGDWKEFRNAQTALGRSQRSFWLTDGEMERVRRFIHKIREKAEKEAARQAEIARRKKNGKKPEHAKKPEAPKAEAKPVSAEGNGTSES